MDGKSTLGLAAATAVALWAFLSLTSTHDAERQAEKLQMDADKARFDRDFARQLGDKEGEDDAKKRLVKMEAKSEQAERDAEAKRKLEEAARDAVKVEAAPDAAKVVYLEQARKACIALGKSEKECDKKGETK